MTMKVQTSSTAILTNKHRPVMVDDDNVVMLPWDIILPFAAQQNFESDLRRNIVKGPHEWKYERDGYLRDASEIVYEMGQNYLPCFEDMPRLVMVRTGRPPRGPTLYHGKLIDMFDFCYSNPERKIVMPHPAKHNNYLSIERYLLELTRRFEYH